jgi:organic hydroperoxide reductase OsmC/OhrA
MTTHRYELSTRWTGNLGVGTASYSAYGRDYEVSAAGKPDLAGSSDPHFRGDPARYNPEELLVASLSACHMLWYLHLCSDAGVVVDSYEDLAWGSMAVGPDGGGAFSEVVLRPRVTVARPEMVDVAVSMHARAHKLCFVANSVNFPVRHEPAVSVQPA